MIKLLITPKPKPRMTQRSAQAGRHADYWEYKARLREAARLADFELGGAFRVIFLMPAWKSEIEAGYLGKPHNATPDLDNLLKALQDCLLKEDSHCWYIEAQKLWAKEGAILIENLIGKDKGLIRLQ